MDYTAIPFRSSTPPTNDTKFEHGPREDALAHPHAAIPGTPRAGGGDDKAFSPPASPSVRSPVVAKRDTTKMVDCFVKFHARTRQHCQDDIRLHHSIVASHPRDAIETPYAFRRLNELNELQRWVARGHGNFPVAGGGKTGATIDRLEVRDGRLLYHLTTPGGRKHCWFEGGALDMAPPARAAVPAPARLPDRRVRELARMKDTFKQFHAREWRRTRADSPRRRELEQQLQWLRDGTGRFPAKAGERVKARVDRVVVEGSRLAWYITPEHGRASKWWDGSLLLGPVECTIHAMSAEGRKLLQDRPRVVPRHPRPPNEREAALKVFDASLESSIAYYVAAVKRAARGGVFARRQDAQAMAEAELHLKNITLWRRCIQEGAGYFPLPDAGMPSMEFVRLANREGRLLFQLRDGDGHIRNFDAGIPYVDPDAPASGGCCPRLGRGPAPPRLPRERGGTAGSVPKKPSVGESKSASIEGAAPKETAWV